MGLWPHYALLNHSCAPNTISYAHLGMLLTRSSRANITKGAELTTNYIGDLVMRYCWLREGGRMGSSHLLL